MPKPQIHLVGEAANYLDILRGHVDPSLAEIVALPREAALVATHDGGIAPADIVVSLRLRRDGGPLPAMRMLHVPGAGLDGIDMAQIPHGTVVCNVFEHEGPIAEFVLASILEWTIGLAGLARDFDDRTWSDTYRRRRPHGEVQGKILGLIGHGRIGRAVADRARALGIEVIAVDAAVTEPSDGLLPPQRLSELLAAADYLAIACPLTDETRGLIGAAQLAAMKPSAVLINVSRAEIVDEAALYAALSRNTIRGASLDVWYRYPKGSDDQVAPSERPFHALPNAICTPHSAAWTRELMLRRYRVIGENITALLTGGPLRNVVRPAASGPIEKDVQ